MVKHITKQPSIMYGKDLICTQDLSDQELQQLLAVAVQVKQNRFSEKFINLLKNKSFFMLFYNPSVRTRTSFEVAAVELGAHAIYMTPQMGRFKTQTQAGETIEDIARVISRYASGMGIRIEDAGICYGDGYRILREYAEYAEIPVINMADDRFHPCQGLADIMGWAEYFGENKKPNYSALQRKKLLITWARGALHRSKTSPQESLLLASRFGMDITIAHPKGYELDDEVLEWTQLNCRKQNSTFKVVNDAESEYEGAHVVYSRNWISNAAYGSDGISKQSEIDKALKYSEWTLTRDKMARTENAIFTHPMPVDRGNEVENEIASGAQSVIYNVAENRLHVQKAILALTMDQFI